jgi:hypothetical protein
VRRATWFVVAVSLMGLAGCASTAQAPPAVDISGKWQGTWVALAPSQGGDQITVPAGATGTLSVNGDDMSGTIAGMNDAKVTLKRVK